MKNERIASRLDHYIWPDGSVTPGSPIQTYAQACVEYERRSKSPRTRVVLAKAHDGLGYAVHDMFRGDAIRATPGNVYPRPAAL